MTKPAQVAAYYFGNYHVDPRNEARYGKGWTEWELVKASVPRFPGHRQPRVPLWGYTDEADPAAMAQKIDAAADHGIDAFIFDWYHYDDGPFLSRSIDEGFLHAPNNDRIKFALMWANHDWVEMFPANKNAERKLLYPGRVSPETFDHICDHVIQDYFLHPSYWCIDGRPYFSIYELQRFMDIFGSLEGAREGIQRFRAKVRAAGFPDLHLNAVYWGNPIVPGESVAADPVKLIEDLGFDSVTSYVWIHHAWPDQLETPLRKICDDYFRHWEKAHREFRVPYFPNASVGWDPAPRTNPNDIWTPDFGYPYMNTIGENEPADFRAALQRIRDRMDADPTIPRILTVNCWNEWTEGSYLEPDTQYGFGYLEALRSVFG